MNNRYDESTSKFVGQYYRKMDDLVRKVEDIEFKNELDTISETNKAVANESNIRFDNAQDRLNYIICDTQKLSDECGNEKNERNIQMNAIRLMFQESISDSKDITEQRKSQISNVHYDISNRIDNLKGYMLNSNQALREQVRNNFGELRNENSPTRRISLK
jgi:hypothetical protein